MNGEDFAFYRWHNLKWPSASVGCRLSGDPMAWCRRQWVQMNAKAKR